MVPTLIILIVEETQPQVLAELQRRRLLRRGPVATRSERVLVDVTERAIASAVGEGVTPSHCAYRRHNGALRQVRQ